MAAPLYPPQLSERSPRLPLLYHQRRGPAAQTCGTAVSFDPSPYPLPAVSRSPGMGSPRLRVRNPGVRDLRGCDRELFPGGVGAAGPSPENPVPGGDAGDVLAPGVPGIPEAWVTILASAGVRRHAEMSEPQVVPQKARLFTCSVWDADRQENVSGHCVGFRAPSFWPVPLVAVGTASSSQPWAVCMSLLEL
ncbi:Collagen Alpha-6(Vi) Chain [Manis pentadactyla]|nr:Collagen Alpha-6(Vi) Chain [Manis pentadactyla]